MEVVLPQYLNLRINSSGLSGSLSLFVCFVEYMELLSGGSWQLSCFLSRMRERERIREEAKL